MLIEAAGERTEQEARQMEFFFPNEITYALSQIVKVRHRALDKNNISQRFFFFLCHLQKLQFSSTPQPSYYVSCRSDVDDAVRWSKFIAHAFKFDTTATTTMMSEPTKKASKLWRSEHSRLIKCHANEGRETEGGEAAAKLWPWMRKQQGLGIAVIKQLNGLFHLQLW